MTKTEFLALLEQRLMVLNDDERADLLSEYEQHIEMKVASGLSEEDAITDFGDPEELIKELLDAYHLNTNYQPSGSASTMRITYYVKSFAHFFSSMFDTLFHYSIRDLFKLFLQACFLLVFLGAIALGGSLVHSMMWSTIGQLWLGRILIDIIEILAWIIYMALVIYMIIFFIKRYIMTDYEPLEPPVVHSYAKEPAFHMDDLHLDEHLDNAKTYVSNAAEQTGDAFSRMKQKAAESREQRAAEKAARPPKAPREPKERKSIPFPDISLSALCMKVIVWCCKFIAFFFLIGAGLCALALLACSAAMLVFVITGYQIVGPFLMVLGCTLLSLVCTGMLMQFVFGIGGAKA
ncbi:MAG: DUF1700 domain-containing protein [Peptococcaceae bacterium]|nr:DUF1700 domain-containing protein [Peptococcaceae bacterium]